MVVVVVVAVAAPAPDRCLSSCDVLSFFADNRPCFVAAAVVVVVVVVVA